MNNAILIIGGVVLTAAGAGMGFVGANQLHFSKQISEHDVTAVIPLTPEKELEEASNVAPLDDFAEGFEKALAVVKLGRDQRLEQVDEMLADIMAESGDSFAAIGMTDDAVAHQISAIIAPSSTLQKEYDLMAEDLAMAQDIAQLAISERDAARIELVQAMELAAILEDQLSNDAILQGFDAERTRLIASLALEQQRVSVLRDALKKADTFQAKEVEKTLDTLGESDVSVSKLSSDIDRLSKRYDAMLARLDETRGQALDASNDLTATLDELEFTNAQLNDDRQKLNETQAAFVNLERERLTVAASVEELYSELEAKRTQIKALEIVQELDIVREVERGLDGETSQPLGQEQAEELKNQVIALRDLLQPLQSDFDSQVEQQAALKAETLAEEMAQEIARELAVDRAKILAGDMARDMANQLAVERANIMADLIANEKLGEMTPQELEEMMGVRIVTDQGSELDDMLPLRAYLYQRLLAASVGASEQRRLVDGRLLLSTNTLFPEGGVQLSVAGQAELRGFGEDLIETLREAEKQTSGPIFMVQVNGHADRTPFRRSQFGNWELSALRAVSVIEFLIKEVGFPAERLVAAAFGEHQPLVEGDTPEAYALNRRIEFRLVD